MDIHLKEFSEAIADYMVEEYNQVDNISEGLNTVQKNTMGAIINYCYENGDSVNNTASYLIEFIRKQDKNEI
tara:strand:- start:1192 stop:1407 length:216 start_codon:yes stop_codon:yes gene_type:complete